MGDFVKTRFPVAIYRGLIIDLEDRLRGEALKAHRMIQDHSGLDPRRARALEGLSRFHMMEKGFQEVCELHGGALLDGGIIPGTDFKVFQPFMRFEHEGQGFILGLAAMPEPSKLPVKNKSRKAGVTLNYRLSPHFDFDGLLRKSEIFAFCFFLPVIPNRRARSKNWPLASLIPIMNSTCFTNGSTSTSRMTGMCRNPARRFPHLLRRLPAVLSA